MKFVFLFSVVLSTAILTGISSAQASCPEPLRSQGGAELLVVSDSIRVRYERTTNGIDFGLKLTLLGEDFVRQTRTYRDNSVVEIMGEIAMPRVGSQAAFNKDLVRVMLVDNLLVVSTPKILIVRNEKGQISCSPPNPGAVENLVIALSQNGVKHKIAKVVGTTEDAFAEQLGL